MDDRRQTPGETSPAGPADPRRLTSVLRSASQLVAKGWSSWAPARDSSGLVCSPDDPDAVAFDCLGALYASTGDFCLVADALEFLDALTPNQSVTLWQDAPDRTQAEVVQLFTRAWLRASRIS